MPTDRPHAIEEALLWARDTLAGILREFPETASRAGDLLAALGDIERALRADGPAGGSAPAPRAAKSSGRKPKRYVLETAGNDEVLAEYRADDPRPFRAPRPVYEGVVKVLAKAKAPLQASEIREQVGRTLGETPPEYAVRLCLRFLTSPPVGLAARHRARYVAVDVRALAESATRAITACR